MATRYDVDRRTVHRWLLRCATEGLGALSDRSSVGLGLEHPPKFLILSRPNRQ